MISEVWPAEVISRSPPRRFHLTCNIKETPHHAANCLPIRKLATGIAVVVSAAVTAETLKTLRVKLRMAIAVTWRGAVGGIPLLSVGSNAAGLAMAITEHRNDRASSPLSPCRGEGQGEGPSTVTSAPGSSSNRNRASTISWSRSISRFQSEAKSGRPLQSG